MAKKNQLDDLVKFKSDLKQQRPPKFLTDAIGELNTPDKNHRTIAEQMTPDEKDKYYAKIIEENENKKDSTTKDDKPLSNDIKVKPKVNSSSIDNKLVKAITELNLSNMDTSKFNIIVDDDSFKFINKFKYKLKMDYKINVSTKDMFFLCVQAFKEKNKKHLEDLGIE